MDTAQYRIRVAPTGKSSVDVFSQIEPFVLKHKAKLVDGAGRVDAAVSDEGLRTVAVILHALLPLPVRMVVKKDALAGVLIANRPRMRKLLE